MTCACLPKWCVCCPCSYLKMSRVIKILVLLEAALLIVVGVFRLISFFKIGSFANYVITFYLFLFAIVLAMLEFGVNYFKRNYYFMNFAWGKAIFFIFLGSLILTQKVKPALEIPAGIILLASALLLIIMSIVYRKEERERVEAALQKIDPKIEIVDNQSKG